MVIIATPCSGGNTAGRLKLLASTATKLILAASLALAAALAFLRLRRKTGARSGNP
jgi:hypothetical protein